MKTVFRRIEQIEETTTTRKVVCADLIEFRGAEGAAHLQNCNAVQKYRGENHNSFIPAEIDSVQRVRRLPIGLTAKERMLIFQVSTLYRKHADIPGGDCGRLVEVCA